MTAKPPPPLHQVANATVGAAFAAAGSLAAGVLVLLVVSPGGAGGIGVVVGSVFFLGVMTSLLHAFGLGMPLYLLLRRRWALSAARACVGGFAVGTIPWLLLNLGTEEPAPALADAVGFGGLPGAIGGLVFWALLRNDG